MLIFLSISMWFVGLIYETYTLTLLWSWFVVPFGITNITFPWAMGLSCLAALFKGLPPSNKNEDEWLLRSVKNLVLVTIILVIGSIAHKFM